jgi:4'-phosphopantetheinyl transferase
MSGERDVQEGTAIRISCAHGKLHGVKGIRMWCADLDAAVDSVDLEALSDDERERGARFRFDVHRRRFLHCRALLRKYLAETLGTDAASIAFRYGPYGKPEVDGVHFNVSHSDHLAVIAVSHEHPIGIDVEHIDDSKEVLALASTAFSRAECEALSALPPDEQILSFYRTWARKEAYLKLLGTGFSLASDSFTLSSLTDCTIEDLDVHPHFACALAKPS